MLAWTDSPCKPQGPFCICILLGPINIDAVFTKPLFPPRSLLCVNTSVILSVGFPESSLSPFLLVSSQQSFLPWGGLAKAVQDCHHAFSTWKPGPPPKWPSSSADLGQEEKACPTSGYKQVLCSNNEAVFPPGWKHVPRRINKPLNAICNSSICWFPDNVTDLTGGHRSYWSNNKQCIIIEVLSFFFSTHPELLLPQTPGSIHKQQLGMRKHSIRIALEDNPAREWPGIKGMTKGQCGPYHPLCGVRPQAFLSCCVGFPPPTWK